MREEILSQLDLIERQNQVSIIFAIESGSRAWGFPSVDSDYDVRFVYAHKRDWYLSVAAKRDVIELPADPVLDINGWDIRKALQLLRKSNISLMEWISSPIRYRRNEELFAVFQSVVSLGFSKEASARHYLSMAKTNIAKTLGEHVRMKSYLYAIRPLLCTKWILDKNTQPPMRLRDLVSEYHSGTEVDETINLLITTKSTQTEIETVPTNDILNRFIAVEYDNLIAKCPSENSLPALEDFDEAFREIIACV